MSKGSDQTARMSRLIWGFVGRTYHIVGNTMSRLYFVCRMFRYYSFQIEDNKGADQTVQMRRLVCTLVVHMQQNGSQYENSIHHIAHETYAFE